MLTRSRKWNSFAASLLVMFLPALFVRDSRLLECRFGQISQARDLLFYFGQKRANSRQSNEKDRLARLFHFLVRLLILRYWFWPPSHWLTHDKVQLQPDDDVLTKEGVIPKTTPGEASPSSSREPQSPILIRSLSSRLRWHFFFISSPSLSLVEQHNIAGAYKMKWVFHIVF